MEQLVTRGRLSGPSPFPRYNYAPSGWSCSQCCPCRQTLFPVYKPALAWELPSMSPEGRAGKGCWHPPAGWGSTIAVRALQLLGLGHLECICCPCSQNIRHCCCCSVFWRVQSCSSPREVGKNCGYPWFMEPGWSYKEITWFWQSHLRWPTLTRVGKWSAWVSWVPGALLMPRWSFLFGVNCFDVYPRNAVSSGLSLCVHIFKSHSPPVQCEPCLAILLRFGAID